MKTTTKALKAYLPRLSDAEALALRAILAESTPTPKTIRATMDAISRLIRKEHVWDIPGVLAISGRLTDGYDDNVAFSARALDRNGSPALIFNTVTGRFLLMSEGDFVAKYERRYGIF